MTKRLIIFTIFLATLGGGGWYLYLTFIYRPTFPELKSDSYLGSITINNEINTFYIEHFSPKKAIMLIIAPNEEAKPISLLAPERTLYVDLSERFFDRKDDVVSFAPVQISLNKTPYLLHGHENGDYLEGEVVDTAGQKVGTWIAAKYQPQDRVAKHGGQDMQAWLSLARRERILQRRLENLSTAEVDQEQEVQTYKRLLSTNALRFKAERLKLELERKLYLLNNQLSDAKAQISDLVDDLALYGRISNEGKAVLLTRRVSRRENKWYLANWADSRFGDTEISAAQRMGVDLESINQAASRAEEIRRLQLEIKKERQKIELLRKPTSPEPEAEFNSEQPPQEKKRKRLFGIF